MSLLPTGNRQVSGLDLLFIAAAVALLLFALLAIGVAKRRRGRGIEPPDPRPSAPIPPPASTGEPAITRPPPSGAAPSPTAGHPTPYAPWRLLASNMANPDSAGGPLYRLSFTPEDDLPVWHAGAIATVYCGPAQDVLGADIAPVAASGDYMIASLPEDDVLELVVRLISIDGQDGKRSRWLCGELQTGQQVAIAVRDDPAFLPPPDPVPLILIGNATGIAGLCAHIKARSLGTRNWLIFGDRNSADDDVLAAEITEWVSTGHLERCDLVLPGEGAEQRHVTDQIDDANGPLLDWTLAGAAIYVCGSRLMGDDVHEALSTLLSAEVLEAMAEAGLYRRAIF